MDFVIEKLLLFVLVLTRISTFFLVAPVFSWKSIPARVKAGMTAMLALFFATIAPSSIDPAKVSPLEAGLLMCNEAIYGFALGLIAMMLFTVVKFAGRIVERQMGLAMAEVLDPMTGERAQPLGMLLEMIFIIIFMAANGHHLFLLTLSKSYEAFPLGTIPGIPTLATGVVRAGSTLLLAGLRLSAPILAAFLVLMVILAVLARIAPEMNILFISLPLRVGLGLLMVAIFLPMIETYVSEFADWMNKLLPL